MNRVAILITSKGRPGGVERRFVRVSEELQRRGNIQTLILASASFLSEFEGKGATEKVPLNEHRLLKRASEIVGYVRSKAITHLHIASNPGWLAALVSLMARGTGCRVTISSVNSSKVDKTQFGVHARLSHWFTYKSVSAIDFLSESILKRHQNFFCVAPDKCYVSFCSFLANEASQLPAVEKDIDICFVSRLVPLKGVELFVDALSEIHQSLNIRICGEGPLEGYIASRFNEISHHAVKIGYCENPVNVFSRSRIFVSLQTYNNYPSQSVFEAIKNGCLVVATDVGETRKILNDENSILIRDKGGLVGAITIGLENDLLRSSLIKESQEVFKKHNVENFSDYFEREILSLESSH